MTSVVSLSLYRHQEVPEEAEKLQRMCLTKFGTVPNNKTFYDCL